MKTNSDKRKFNIYITYYVAWKDKSPKPPFMSTLDNNIFLAYYYCSSMFLHKFNLYKKKWIPLNKLGLILSLSGCGYFSTSLNSIKGKCLLLLQVFLHPDFKICHCYQRYINSLQCISIKKSSPMKRFFGFKNIKD